MNKVYLLIIYGIFLSVLIVMNYYINLWKSKNEYTKDEIKDVFPHFLSFLKIIGSQYSPVPFLVLLLLSSLLGFLIPYIPHWFFYSSIILIVMFLVFPIITNSIEQSKVMAAGDMKDIAANIFAKHSDIIIIGFGTGLGSSLIFRWGSLKEISFLWFLVNIIIISIIIELTLIKSFNKK